MFFQGKKVMMQFCMGILVAGGLTFTASGPVQAVGTAFTECPSLTTGTNCLAAFEIKTPGSGNFVKLTSISSSSNGVNFQLPSDYTPNFGSRNVTLFVNLNEFDSMSGGSALGTIKLTNSNPPMVGMYLNTGVDTQLIYRISVNLGNVFPGPANFYTQDANPSFSNVESGLQFVLESKSMEYMSEFSTECASCGGTVSNHDQVGKFEATFWPRMNITQNYYPNYSDPMFNAGHAWFAVETNGSALKPNWINNNMYVRLSSAHFKEDSVTLNSGKYRVIMNDAFMNAELGLSREQFLAGNAVTQSAEVGSTLIGINSTSRAVNSDYVELNFGDFHYSSRDMVIGARASMKSTSIAWSGKKSSVKQGKSLAVKVTAKSNKKKAVGRIKVDLVNSQGNIVSSLQANVKKGSGKVTFGKSLTKSLPKGKYSVRVEFQGSVTAKSAVKSYSLKIK